MSAVFSLNQVLACTESATSEYSTTSQCLSALLGRSGRVKFILNGLRWMEKKTNAPIIPVRLLPGNSSPLVVINTAVTRGGEEIRSRGGGGLVHKDTSPVKIKEKPEGENRLDHGPKSPPMANHGTEPGV